MVIDVLENIDCSDGVGLSALKCDVINDAIISIKALPSAERHGKWLDGYGFAGNYFDCFVCDQCKKENMAKTNYCPNCGAKMIKIGR